MSDTLTKLKSYLSNPDVLKDPTNFAGVVIELESIKTDNPDEYERLRRAYLEINPDIQAALSVGDQAGALLRNAGRFLENMTGGKPSDPSREMIRLDTGLAGADYRAAEAEKDDKKDKTKAEYSVERTTTETNALLLFKGDPTRESLIRFANRQELKVVHDALQKLQQTRKGSDEYAGKAPENRQEVALEALSDIYALYEAADKKGDEKETAKLKAALTALLAALNARTEDADEKILNGYAPEAYTGKRQWLTPYYKVHELVHGDAPYGFQAGALAKALEKPGAKKVTRQWPGQDSSYMERLAFLYEMPDVKPLIDVTIRELQKRAASDFVQDSGFYGLDFDVKDWLENFDKYKNDPKYKDYFKSSPISQPLIYLTQQADRLYKENRGWKPTPEQVRKEYGHSQGVVSAVTSAQFKEGQANTKEVIKGALALFWQGFRMQQAVRGFQKMSLADAKAAGIDLSNEAPSPMAFIQGLTTRELQKYISATNKKLPKDKRVYLSISNTYVRKIVSGPQASLAMLFRDMTAARTKDLEKKEKGQLERLPLDFKWAWLDTSAPFHSPYMNGLVEMEDGRNLPMQEALAEDYEREDISWDPSELKTDVLHGKDASNLRELKTPRALTRAMIIMQSTDPVGFESQTAEGAGDYLVDEGPGDGVMGAALSNIAGTDTGFISAGQPAGLQVLLGPDEKKLPKTENFALHRGNVVSLPDGSLAINGRYTRFVHKPPVLVGGMTPTTGSDEIVIAATSYGYHIEIAGGAQGTAKILGDTIDRVAEQLQPGQTMTINLLKVSPYIWGFLPTVKEKVAEGKPISGLTVAAGIPQPDEMKSLLKELNDILMWNVSLKPGNQKAFDEVIELAKQNPDREIVLQIELGAAGGHHSWEGLDLLRLNYRKLREQPNLILLAGGGVRNQEDAAKFIDGTWNIEGVPMPMDGVFLGTRVMAVKQAHTSPDNKTKLVNIPGVPMEDYLTGLGKKSGVVTATAGDGEPIYHVDNTASSVMKWLETNARAASEDDKKRVRKWLDDNRKLVIDSLNGTQKPYFVPVDPADPESYKRDLTSMTYAEVLGRLVTLMKFPTEGEGLRADEKGWIDFSLRNFVGRLMEYFEGVVLRPKEQTAEERAKAGKKEKAKLPDSFFNKDNTEVFEPNNKPPLKHYKILEDDPVAAVKAFFERHSELRNRRMTAQDASNFGRLSNPAVYKMKPLPFIWQLTERIWNEFTGDSLWQSEVRHYAAGATLPEPGPVAVAGIPEVDEDIREVLDMFDLGMKNRLLVRQLKLQAESTETVKVKVAKPAAQSYVLFRDTVKANPGKVVDVVTLEENPAGESVYEVRIYSIPAEKAAQLPKAMYMGGPIQKKDDAKLRGYKSLGVKDLEDGSKVESWEIRDAAWAVAASEKGKGNSEYARFIHQIASNDAGFVSALLTANQFFDGKAQKVNSIRDAMRPKEDQRWEITRHASGAITQIALFDDSFIWTKDASGKQLPVLVLSKSDQEGSDLVAKFNHPLPTMIGADQKYKTLSLYYHFDAKKGYAPIHEDAGNVQRIQHFYDEVLFDQAQDVIEHDQAIVEEESLSAADLRKLLGVFRNQSATAHEDSYEFSDSNYKVVFNIAEIENTVSGKRVRSQATITPVGDVSQKRPPLIAWMKVAWKAFIRTIGGKETQGNLLKLLHFSSGFDVTDLVRAEQGQGVVKSDQEVYLQGQYADKDMAYYRKEHLTETLELKEFTDVARLEGRPWFKKVDGIFLKQDDVLRFEIDVENTFYKTDKKGVTTKHFNTTGKVYRGDTLVGTISYKFPEGDDVNSDEYKRQLEATKKFKNEDMVAAYLAEHAEKKGAVKIDDLSERFAALKDVPLSRIEVKSRSPKSMAAYARGSRDYNPIHRDRYLAAVAGYPAPIVHGMWTWGEVENIVTEQVAGSDHSRILSLKKAAGTNMFLDKLGLDEEIVVIIEHTGNKDGDAFHKVQVYKASDTDKKSPIMVLEARVAPARRADIFTGQGSARLKMFDDWKFSKKAQEVVDLADNIMLKKHGFSIKQVVAEGGYKVRDYKGERFELFADGEKLEAPQGKNILDLTQFQQVALVTYAAAAYKAMEEAGVRSGRELIAGHSLGEYAALVAQGIMRLEDALEVVYQRGKTMQNILKSPAFKGKEFRLAAVRLDTYQKRKGEGLQAKYEPMKEADLEAAVDHVMKTTGKFVQIVNLNAEDRIYSVAGEKEGIAELAKYLDKSEAFKKAPGKEKDKGVNEIPGILVPFHSVLLIPGVPKFRETLLTNLPAELPADKLVGRYIPNLTGKPFSISKEYVQEVYDYTVAISKKYASFLNNQDYSSSLLKDILENYDAWAKTPNKLARALVVELLAYQFASPVQWIKTLKALLAGTKGFEKVAEIREIGAGSDLSAMVGMQSRKEGDKVLALPRPQSTGNDKQRAAILANEILPAEDKKAAKPAAKKEEKPVAKPAAAAALPAPAAAPTPTPVVTNAAAAGNLPPIVAGATGPVADAAGPSIRDAVRAIIALKLKQPLDKVTDDATIDALAGGNSTLGNQTVGDIAEEFGLSNDAIANPKKIPLKELVAAVNASYKNPGSVLRAAFEEYVVKALSRSGMDRKAILAHLAGERLLPTNRMMDVMSHLAIAGREGLFEGVADKDAAIAKLNEAVNQYAVANNLPIPVKSLMGAGGGGGGGATISSEALNEFEMKYFGVEGIFTDLRLQEIERITGKPWQLWFVRKDAEKVTELEAQIAKLTAERIKEYERLTRGVYDSAKVLEFDQNWGSTLLEDLYTRLSNGDFDKNTDPDEALLKIEAQKQAILRWATLDVVDQMVYLRGKAERNPALKNRSEVIKSLNDMIDNSQLKSLHVLRDIYDRLAARKATPQDVADAKQVIRESANGATLHGVRLLMTIAKTHLSLDNKEVILRVLSEIEDDITDAKGGFKYVSNEPLTAPRTEIDEKTGEILFLDKPRVRQLADGSTAVVRTFADFAQELADSYAAAQARGDNDAFVSVRDLPILKNGTEIQGNETNAFLDLIKQKATKGLDFTGMTYWVPGASEGSMGEQLAKIFLAGGATVVISHFGSGKRTPHDELERYKGLRKNFGRFDSRMIVLPMNQANEDDIKANEAWMREHMIIPDGVVPFGAFTPTNSLESSKPGNDAAAEDTMLNSMMWIMGAAARLQKIKNPKKVADKVTGKPVDAPLGDYLTVSGARIGWTNTRLMKDMSILSERLEDLFETRTFSPEEMSFLLAVIASPEMLQAGTSMALLPLSPNHGSFATDWPYGGIKRAMETLYNYVNGRRSQPGFANDRFFDLNGNFNRIPDIAQTSEDVRQGLKADAERAKANYDQNQKEVALRGEITDKDQEAAEAARQREVHADWEKYFGQGHLKPSFEQLRALAEAQGIKNVGKLDLSKVYVIVGSDEVGPWLNKKIRREFEVNGKLSLESIIYYAKRLNLITWKETKDHSGWWDIKDDKALSDLEVKEKHEKYIMENSGVREVDPEVAGFDPRNIIVWVEKALKQSQDISYGSKEQADAVVEFNRKQYGHAEDALFAFERNGQWLVHFPPNHTVRYPEPLKLDRYVAGQIPKGWNAESYGIPKEIIDQVDPLTLYALVSAIEALFDMGVTDFMDVAGALGLETVGNTFGSGMGGMNSMTHLQKKYKLGEPRKNDVLQETLINVLKAWVTQRMLKGYGPTQSNVTACAQAAGSVEQGISLLENGSAKVVFVGGADDYGEEGAVGFGDMGATAPTSVMKKKGMPAREHSRPASRRRGGFVEAEGAMGAYETTAEEAIKNGWNIQAIVAVAKSASDGAQASIPAPGQGPLAITAIIKGALEAFGMDADHIDFAFVHGTSTDANDKNEAKFFFKLMVELGRSVGNKLKIFGQKAITGHPKGAAGGWQANGAMQTLNDGTIPGNPFMDDVEPALADLGLMTLLHYSDTKFNYGADALMAGLITNFGFGHEGTVIMMINRLRVLMELNEQQLNDYYKATEAGERRVIEHKMKFMTGKLKPASEKDAEHYYEFNDKKPFDVEGLTQDQIDLLEADYLLHPDTFYYDKKDKIFRKKPRVADTGLTDPSKQDDIDKFFEAHGDGDHIVREEGKTYFVQANGDRFEVYMDRGNLVAREFGTIIIEDFLARVAAERQKREESAQLQAEAEAYFGDDNSAPEGISLYEAADLERTGGSAPVGVKPGTVQPATPEGGQDGAPKASLEASALPRQGLDMFAGIKEGAENVVQLLDSAQSVFLTNGNAALAVQPLADSDNVDDTPAKPALRAVPAAEKLTASKVAGLLARQGYGDIASALRKSGAELTPDELLDIHEAAFKGDTAFLQSVKAEISPAPAADRVPRKPVKIIPFKRRAVRQLRQDTSPAAEAPILGAGVLAKTTGVGNNVIQLFPGGGMVR